MDYQQIIKNFHLKKEKIKKLEKEEKEKENSIIISQFSECMKNCDYNIYDEKNIEFKLINTITPDCDIILDYAKKEFKFPNDVKCSYKEISLSSEYSSSFKVYLKFSNKNFD